MIVNKNKSLSLVVLVIHLYFITLYSLTNLLLAPDESFSIIFWCTAWTYSRSKI